MGLAIIDLNLIKKKYNLPNRYILFVGGITPLKNFSNILRAFKIIKNKTSIKLIVVGFKRWKYAKDICLINQLNLQNDIITLGFIPDEDLPYLYSSAQCLTLPSLYEGFGIPILEAQACGCPVICSKTGCAPEVSDGAALLVNPYNYKEIAQAIDDVLNDEDLRKKLIAAGIENVKEFSWLKAAEQTLQLFKKISKSKSA
jgi:glycosyltransferase involved in cell wall biosynthesis